MYSPGTSSAWHCSATDSGRLSSKIWRCKSSFVQRRRPTVTQSYWSVTTRQQHKVQHQWHWKRTTTSSLCCIPKGQQLIDVLVLTTVRLGMLWLRALDQVDSPTFILQCFDSVGWVDLPVKLSVCLFVCLLAEVQWYTASVCLSVCVFVSRGTVIHGVCLSVCLSVCVFVSRGTVIHGVCLSLCLCVC